MLPGFNHNVKHKDRIFHVQTEDSGIHNPHVITHIFVGGNIIATMKRGYEHLLGKTGQEFEDDLRALMQEQHKQMLRALVQGKYDHATLDNVHHLDGPLPLNVDPSVLAFTGGSGGRRVTGEMATLPPEPRPANPSVPPPAASSPTLPPVAAVAPRPTLPPAASVSSPSLAPVGAPTASLVRAPTAPPMPAVAPPPAGPARSVTASGTSAVTAPPAALPYAVRPPPSPTAAPLPRPTTLPPGPVLRPQPPVGAPPTLPPPPARPAVNPAAHPNALRPTEPLMPAVAPRSPIQPIQPTPPPAARPITVPPPPAAAAPRPSPSSTRNPTLPPEVLAARTLAERPVEKPVTSNTIFGEDLISEKSLDEVILAYLSLDDDPASR